MPKRTQLVPIKTQLAPKHKDFLRNEEILNTTKRFKWVPKTPKSKVPQKVPKRVDTNCNEEDDFEHFIFR